MKTCSLISNLESGLSVVRPEEISATILKKFSNPALATVYMETTKQVILIPLKDFSFPLSFATCMRLIVSNEYCEARFEHKQGSDIFFCRILEEGEGDEYLYREDHLILRSSFCNGRGRMRHREYFRPDEDGMYCFYADRLAGFCDTKK